MVNFENQEQLEEYLFPVLNMRKRYLEKDDNFLEEHEIFEILRDKKWKYQKNLYLHEIVDDILHYDLKFEVNNK